MNVRINSIEYYHPTSVYTNKFFIDHFSKQGKDITGLLNACGRENRYISENPNENSLTMAIEACKKVIKNSDIEASNIDLIVCISTTPEYLSPANAIKIHYALGLNKNALAYDMNSNCAGLIVGVDQISKIMKSDSNIKYALVVGTDQLFRHSDPNEPLTYANFGESACAILLESSNTSSSDFVDSSYYVYNNLSKYVSFPPKGLSNLLSSTERLNKNDTMIKYDDFDFNKVFAESVTSINELLSKNNLNTSDIKLYCLSQFAKSNIDLIQQKLEEPKEKFPYIGDEFGYTGLTSPFIALKDSIDKNKINRGDYILLWTIGVGVITPTLLIKY